MSALYTINALLENSEIISKWQGTLESEKGSQGELGVFLRLLHYMMFVMLTSETEPILLVQELRICSTLLSVTPYTKMRAGLASLLLCKVVELLREPSSLLNTSKNSTLVNTAFKTLLTGFNLPQDLYPELISNFLANDESNLIKFIIEQDFLDKSYD